MKALKLVFIIVTILKWIALLFNGIMVYFFIKIFYLKKIDYNFDFNGFSVLSDNEVTKYCIVLSIISSIFVFFSIYFFEKLLKNFNQKYYFDSNSTTLLNYIGHSLILSFIFYSCSKILYYIYDKSPLTSLNFGFWILLIFALFFYVLSAIFKFAGEIKEENELTI